MVRMTSGDKIDTRNHVTKMDVVDVPDRKLVMVSENTDGHIDFTKTNIYKQLRPLLTLMRIFGVFFRRNISVKGRINTETTVVYCAFMSLIMVMNVARSFTVYRVADQFDHVLVQRVLFTIWSTECTCKAVLMFVYCFSQDGLPLFFREWYIVCKNSKLDSFSLVMMKKYIVLALLFILVNSVVFTLVLIYVPMLEHIYLDVVWRDASKSDIKFIYKIILGGLAILNSSSSMFPVSIFVVLSCAVAKRLRKFTDEFSTSVKEDDFHERLQDFRLRHQNLCTLVEILDRIFAPMMAAVFFANIPMFCLVLYTMVTSIDIHISLVLLNLFWLSFILLQMTIVSVTAAFVNVKAHSPLQHVYGIRFVSQPNSDVQLQMHLFLNRLTGTQIGITAMKMFVIDKPTILTVAGMMVTYFVLLLQFKMPPGGATHCECNINGTINMDNGTLFVSQI